MGKYGFGRVPVASSFRGINQAVDDRFLKPGESRDAVNFRCDGGILATAPGYEKHIAAALPAAPVTPMIFHEYRGDGTIAKRLLAATADDLYCWDPNEARWVSIRGAETITSGDFSYANYRESGVSKIILSNGVDPVYEWSGGERIARLYSDAGPPPLEAPRGRCVTIHAERLWVGGVAGAPNTVFASDAYAPSNWTVGDYEAGYLSVSTWDGGDIVGLASLLGDVVVFKQTSIFRIVGTYPDEFQPVQVMTMEGAIAPRTLCQYDNRAYFLSDDGLMAYDTIRAYEVIPNALADFWAGVNRAALPGACGIAHNNRVYMAVPYGAGQTDNNRVIEYDIVSGSVAIRSGITIRRFLQDDEDLLFVGPGNHIYRYGCGAGLDGGAVDMVWNTPVSDFGAPGVKCIYDAVLTAWSPTAGGEMQVELLRDGGAIAAKTIALPPVRGVVRAPLRGSGRVLGFRLRNVSGSDVRVASLEVECDYVEDL
jgi:hypothetical protein